MQCAERCVSNYRYEERQIVGNELACARIQRAPTFGISSKRAQTIALARKHVGSVCIHMIVHALIRARAILPKLFRPFKSGSLWNINCPALS